MNSINPVKAGGAVGLFAGGWHVLWVLLVALRWAQPLVDLIFWLHFIAPVYQVERLAPVRAFLLIGTTTVIGFAVGAIFAMLWNAIHREKAAAKTSAK